MTGVVKRVSTWLTISPPTIVTPRGWRSSDPMPVPSMSGTAERRAAIVVIRMGRNLRRQAWKIASRGGSPSFRSASSAKSIIMIAFFFTIPMRRMMPMIPMTPRSLPTSSRARRAPIPADGQRGQDRDRMDEALVEDAQDDVHRHDRGGDQEELVGERALERVGRALEGRHDARGHAELRLGGADGLDRAAERAARAAR